MKHIPGPWCGLTHVFFVFYCIAAIGLGGGPEDPVADAVAAAIGTACGVACETAIKTQHLIPGTPTFEKYMCQKMGF